MPYLVILAGDTNTSIAFECKIYTLPAASIIVAAGYNGDISRNVEVNRATLLYQLARTTSIIMESHAAQWQIQTFF